MGQVPESAFLVPCFTIQVCHNMPYSSVQVVRGWVFAPVLRTMILLYPVLPHGR